MYWSDFALHNLDIGPCNFQIGPMLHSLFLLLGPLQSAKFGPRSSFDCHILKSNYSYKFRLLIIINLIALHNNKYNIMLNVKISCINSRPRTSRLFQLFSTHHDHLIHLHNSHDTILHSYWIVPFSICLHLQYTLNKT